METKRRSESYYPSQVLPEKTCCVILYVLVTIVKSYTQGGWRSVCILGFFWSSHLFLICGRKYWSKVKGLAKKMYVIYLEDFTCPRVDMNFIFEWSTRYLTLSLRSLLRYRVEHEKIEFISISGYVIFCLFYKHQWNTKWACFQRRDLLCNHNDGDLFTCEDNMLSSRVKIWSFRGKAHLVFHWCLYNKYLYLEGANARKYTANESHYDFGCCLKIVSFSSILFLLKDFWLF